MRLIMHITARSGSLAGVKRSDEAAKQEQLPGGRRLTKTAARRDRRAVGQDERRP